MVACAEQALKDKFNTDFSGKCVVVMGGTGPVGSTAAVLAAKAGATFISPFIGRLDDNGHDGLELIQEIRQIYDNYQFNTEILAASARNVLHVKECALIGADVITAPAKVIDALAKHVLTDKGLEAFLADWAKTGQTI